MSTNLSVSLDSAGTWRLTTFGFVACLLVGAFLAYSPWIAVGACAVLLVVALAVGLHSRNILTPLWPFAIVATLQPLNGLRPLPFMSVGDVALAVAGIATLPFIRRAKPPMRVLAPLIGTFLVTAGGLLGMMASQDWAGSVEMVKFILGAPTVILVVILMNPSPRMAVVLLQCYALGGVISGIGAMAGRNDPYMMRAAGYGAHLGHLGLATLFGFFVMLGWFIRTTNPWLKVMTSIMGMICIYGMLLTGMRSAVLGLTLGLVFVALTGRFRGVVTLIIGGTVSLAFLVVVVPFLPASENVQRIFGQGEVGSLVSESNEAHRQVFWDAIHIIGSHPWTGIGFGQGLEAHNLLLQTVNLGGPIALIGLIVIWGTFFLLMVQRLSFGLTRQTAMATCLLAGVLGYFVIAQFEPLIWDRHLWFFLVLALIAQVPTEDVVPSTQPVADRSEIANA